MRRTFSVRVLLIVLLVIVVLGAGTFFLHNWQVNRQIQIFLQKADEAVAEKDPQKARDYLGRYLLLQPGNLEAQNRYAFLLDDSAKSGPDRTGAYLKLGALLRMYLNKKQEPPPELYKRAALRAYDLKQYRAAETHLAPLLAAKPNDVELLQIKAECHHGLGELEKAADLYSGIIRMSPTQLKCYMALAEIQSTTNKKDLAEQTLNQMVEANPRSPEARLARSKFFSEQGKLKEAKADLDVAVGFSGKEAANADILLSSAELAAGEKKVEEARKFLNLGMAQFPKDVRFHVGLAQMELAKGKEGKVEALAIINQAIPNVGDDPGAQHMVAKILLDAGDRLQAVKFIDRLRNKYGATPVLEYFRARLLIEDNKVGEAISILERIKDGLIRIPRIAVDCDYLLANAYEQMGNPDRRLLSFERILKVDSSITMAQVGKAETLVTLGRPSEAIELFRKLLPTTAAVRFPLIRLLIGMELKKPEQQRNWTEVNTLLSGVSAEEKKSKEYQLSTFQVLSAAGKQDDLDKAISQACRDNPKEVSYWMAKYTILAQRPGMDQKSKTAGLEQVLQEAERAAGDQAEIRLAKAFMSLNLPRDKALPLLETLERNTDQWNVVNRIALNMGLAQVYVTMGFNKDSRRLLNMVLELNPFQFMVMEALVDLALDEKDDSEALRLIKVMREKEGDEGYHWRWASLSRIYSKMQAGERSLAIDARKLLDELSKLRPGWNKLASAQGRFFELNGQPDLAVEQFKKAIDLGERTPDVVKKTVQMLTKRRRPEEAKEILKLVMVQGNFDPNYSKLATEVSLRSADTSQQTLEKAKQAVRADSQDYRDYLWLGNICWASDDKVGAEQAFKKAVALAKDEPEAWASWLVYLIKMDRKSEAATEVKNAEAILKDKATYVLTAYYQALDQRDKAEEQYIKLVKDYPSDLGMLQGLITFYFRNGDFTKAENLLKKQVESTVLDTNAMNWSRRTYALTLAAKPDYQSFKEAVALVEKNLKENANSPEDLRTRALVLSTRPGPRQDIIRDLQTSFAMVKPTPNEAVLLAQLYEFEGDWDKAKSTLAEMVADKEGEAPNFLSYYIQALVRHKELALAADLMKKLEAKAPGQPITIEPKAKLLFAEGKNSEAVELLTSQANKLFSERNDPTLFLYVSNLLEQGGQKEAAEKMVKQFISAGSAKIPTAVLALVELYSRQGRVSEAIAICEENWTKLPLGNVAMACVAALNTGKATTQETQRIEAKLQNELKTGKFNLGVTLALADLYNQQKRNAEAETLYRTILQKEKDNPIALNNLAWQLSERMDAYEEAIQLITKAIDRYGPEGAFLDTRGMIFLRNGKFEQAIKDLEEAVSKAPSPDHWLHLAYGEHKARNPLGAEKSWKKAKSLGLKSESLSATDLGYYQELDRSYRQ